MAQVRIGDDADYLTEPFPYQAGEEITWCQDSVMEAEVKYIRADIHEATVAELRLDLALRDVALQAAEAELARMISADSKTFPNGNISGDSMQETTVCARPGITQDELARAKK